MQLFEGKPVRVAGIDVGTYSTKVVQLRYEKEWAVLETYGELLNEGYLTEAETTGVGFLRFSDENIATLIADVLKESRVTAKEVVFSMPAASSFVTTIPFPRAAKGEIAEAISYEARKYIPIPASEVVLDWEIIESDESDEKTIRVLIAAVPKDVVEKFQRLAGLLQLKLRALEIETFSSVRALIRQEMAPTAIINLGHQFTTIAITDWGRLRVSNSLAYGAGQLTQALERGLNVSAARAETIKREVGLSEKIEEQEIVSIIVPFLETMFSEIERIIELYNRRASRHVKKVDLTGGGSNLKGIVDFVASRLGVEVTRGNPFGRVTTPLFIQPILREIGPSFSVAVGAALHEITAR